MIKEQKRSFVCYRERFEKRRTETFQYAPSGTQPRGVHEQEQRQEQSVHTTWVLNLEALQEEEPAAAELLSLCSLLAPDAIPAGMLFARVVQGEEGREGINFARAVELSPQLVKALNEVHKDERQGKIEGLLRAAQRYSLLDFDAAAAGDGNAWRSVSMHRLVQDAQRQRVQRAENAVALLSELLVAAMPGIEDVVACTGEAMECFHRLRSHVVALWKEAERLGAVRMEVVVLLHVAVMALKSNGEYAEAEAMGRGALLAARRELLPRHPDTLTVMYSLAGVLCKLGKHAEAWAMLQEVLVARCELLGPRHPGTLTTMGNLADTLCKLGKHADAEAMQLEVLAARREVLGPRHPGTLTAMGNLADTLREKGKHAEAEAMQQEVLAAQREVLGPRHPGTLTTMGNLVVTLRALDEHAGAVLLLRELIPAFRATLGDRHPNTLVSINILIQIQKRMRAQGNQ